MKWLTEDWHLLIGVPWCEISLVLFAVLCGAIIGVERERKDKPTGTRTLTLVCLGSAVFTMISGTITDGKIAAQIVSGIGFLGAGAVIHGRFGVSGLTSAATIWAVAAIGMVVGAGYAIAGLALSLLIVAVLTVISAAEQQLLGPCKMAEVIITMKSNGGKTILKLEQLLTEFHLPLSACNVIDISEDVTQIAIRYCYVHAHHHSFLAPVAEMDEIISIEREGAAVCYCAEK